MLREHFDFVWRNVRRLGIPRPPPTTPSRTSSWSCTAASPTSRAARRSGPGFSASSRASRETIAGRARRQNARALAVAAEAEPAATPTPADLASRREAARILEELLERIDDDKREVFVLVELEQMSVADVAEALSLNVNTAHARLRAARQECESAATRFRAKEKK